MKFITLLFIFISTQFCFASNSSEALPPGNSSVGMMMVVRGGIKVTSSDGLLQHPKVGHELFVGDQIVTEGDGFAKIVMKDRNVMVVTENTKMSIDKYSMAPQAKQVIIYLDHGSIRHSLEQKYKVPQEYYEVQGDKFVAGVRGTDFLTELDSALKQITICTLEGLVAFKDSKDSQVKGHTVNISAGDFLKFKIGSTALTTKKAEAAWIQKIKSKFDIKAEPEAQSQK